MSLAVDETAGDLPVRDVGMTRGGLMATVPDTAVRDGRSWKKPQLMTIKASFPPDRQRVFRVPREHLEDQCFRLQEENTLLRQHTRTQEQRLRRLSTKLMRLRQSQPGKAGAALREDDTEDTIQDLELRVASLESQKRALQSKLSMARQHILDLTGHTHHRFHRGRGMDGEGGVRRAAQTAPPRYGPPLEDTRGETERFRSSGVDSQQVRVTELELAAQALRDTLREKEREIEGTVRDMKRQQAEGHRLIIKDNVDAIRLQKQLSEKSTELLLLRERFKDLQEAYESQLEEGQRSLKENQGALLEKMQELTEQLKLERQRALEMEGQLTQATVSLRGLEEFQERVCDLEGERALLKESYDTLLESTLSVQSHREEHADQEREREKQREREKEEILKMDIQRLEEILQVEREERRRLEGEQEGLRLDKDRMEEQRQQERELTELMRGRHKGLEEEVLQYRGQVIALQDRLDSIPKEFDMSVDELSETLLQIKAFRLQQEGREGLRFLGSTGKAGDSSRELVEVQASHAETILELQKTRDLLLLQHRINNDLQAELNTGIERSEREREETRRRLAEKDKLLSRRAQQVNTLQAQLKELAYSPRNYKRTIPIQYTWPGGDQEVMQPIEDDTTFSQLRAGESLLEIHLKAATFTPGGLRAMSGVREGASGLEEVVTFCTYALLDFEMHSTPLVSGHQPSYGFTSRYSLSPRDLGRLGGQGSRVKVELHQALGGVRFVTRGCGHVTLVGALERRGERVSGRVNVTGSEGDVVGMLEFWVRLFPATDSTDSLTEKPPDRLADRWMAPVPRRSPMQQCSLGWQDSGHEELYDYGGGIPNELEVVLERCVGLAASWPGLLPDAYLMYRLYDLPPHTSPTVQCCSDPLFNDAVCYPLAVTHDVLEYLRSGSLWVYVFDDGDDQTLPPPSYLAKTPVPLRALAAGRPVRGDYVLRDVGGGPRGIVRVFIQWKYPFQPPEGASRHRGMDRPKPRPPPIKVRGPTVNQSGQDTSLTSPEHREATPLHSPARKRATPLTRSPTAPLLTPEPSPASPSRSPTRKQAAGPSKSPRRVRPRGSGAPTPVPPGSASSPSARSSTSDARNQDVPSLEQVALLEEDKDIIAAVDSDVLESVDSSASSSSDLIIIPPRLRPLRKGDKLRVEILSLTFGPTSRVAMDRSIQRVYVEYRLLGVPMETTETPMSLRKPTEGEEIHYNFTRVIYVDGSESGPLRQYLYTMLEGTDPNQGRLKFTVVSEPMEEGEEEECVDVGHAFLDLQELLLTGNDVIERQIDIVSVDEEREVIGKLKVSLEAAKTLTGIYWEFHNKKDTTKEDTDEEKEVEDDGETDSSKKEQQIQVIDYDENSDFY
ncbi:protein fantom [Aplochiton taeniatus]